MMMEEHEQRQRQRRRARTRREWEEILRNLPSDASPYEVEVVEFALRRREHFPHPPYEVKRVVEAKVSINSQDNVPVQLVATSDGGGGGTDTNRAPATHHHHSSTRLLPSSVVATAAEDKLDINIAELMQTQGHERSMEYLQNLQPPYGYNPCPTLEQLHHSFEMNNYFLNKDDVFSIHQAIQEGRPIKVDGPPGTGKTELAQQIALAMGLDKNNPLHFGELFCTPDITKSEAFYSWNDARRLVDMQLVSNLSSRMSGEALKRAYIEVSNNAYSPRYLDLQAMMRACVVPYRTVALVDEVDKTYHEFDNYLLMVLDQNKFVVPEYGAVGRSKHEPQNSPIFILTSNQTRSLSGPLVRRCKALFYDYLPENLEEKVIRAKSGLDRMQAGLIAHFFKKIRTHKKLHLQRPPSTAEVIETSIALQNSSMEVTEHNILRMFCHWIKERVDFNALVHEFKEDTGWTDQIPE